MFTGGNRKRTGNGNSNNSSQRSRSRGHQEVIQVLYKIENLKSINAYRRGKKIHPIAIPIGILHHLRHHQITTQTVLIRLALPVAVPQLQVGHILICRIIHL